MPSDQAAHVETRHPTCQPQSLNCSCKAGTTRYNSLLKFQVIHMAYDTQSGEYWFCQPISASVPATSTPVPSASSPPQQPPAPLAGFPASNPAGDAEASTHPLSGGRSHKVQARKRKADTSPSPSPAPDSSAPDYSQSDEDRPKVRGSFRQRRADVPKPTYQYSDDSELEDGSCEGSDEPYVDCADEDESCYGSGSAGGDSGSDGSRAGRFTGSEDSEPDGCRGGRGRGGRFTDCEDPEEQFPKSTQQAGYDARIMPDGKPYPETFALGKRDDIPLHEFVDQLEAKDDLHFLVGEYAGTFLTHFDKHGPGPVTFNEFLSRKNSQ